MRSVGYPAGFVPAVGRVAIFGVLWLILTEGDVAGQPLGLLMVLLASAVSLRLMPARRLGWRLGGVARLCGLLASESFRGGVDVAVRALDPRLPIDPGYIRYAIRLPADRGRLLLACVVSMIPGTLSVRLHDDELLVHVLGRPAHAEHGIRMLEEHIAGALGLSLES